MEEESKKTRVIRSRVDKGWYFADIDKFTRTENNMIVKWWPWAMRYYHTYLSRPDRNIPDDVLYDAIVEALMYCVKTWDKEKRASFKNWFHRGCVINVNKYARRYHTLESKKISENTPTAVIGFDEISTIKDMVSYGSVKWEDDVCSKIVIDEMLSVLNERQREIIKRRFFDKERLSEIGDDYGVSRQAIEQSIRLSLNKIKKHFNMEDIAS